MLYFTVTSKSLVQQQRTRPAPQVLPGPAITNKPSKYARECELDIDSLYCKNGPLMIVFPTGEEEGEGEDGFTYNKEDRHQNRDCKIRFEDRVSFFLLQAKHKMKFELLELRCRMRYIRHRCHEKMLSRECHVVLENNF